jgi:hypothetical protein
MSEDKTKPISFVFKNRKRSFKANFSEFELNRCSFLFRALISSKSSLPPDHTLAPIIVKLQNITNNSILNLIAYVKDEILKIENSVDLSELVVIAIALEIEPLALILLSFNKSIEKPKQKNKTLIKKTHQNNVASLKKLIFEGTVILSKYSLDQLGK